MIIDQVGKRSAVGQRLEGVTHTTWHEDSSLRTHLQREAAAKTVAWSQVDPGPEDPAGGEGNQLVPRLGVNPARGAGGGIERYVVLHWAEVWKSEIDHLPALPVLLEPASAVCSDVKGYH